MKKKSIVFMLLFAFLIGVLVPAAAPVPVKAANATETTADDVKYRDIEQFVEQLGYIGFEKKENCKYLAFHSGDELVVYEVNVSDELNPYWCILPDDNDTIFFWSDAGCTSSNCMVYRFYSMENCAKYDCYSYYSSAQNNYGNYDYYKSQWLPYCIVNVLLDNLEYSDLDIYTCEVEIKSKIYYTPSYTDLLYENNASYTFTFPVWCDFAGLNPLSSTNESPNKIPYSYNDYWHIVRRTSSGKWLLTTIGNSKNQEGMQLRLSEDNGSLIIYNDYEDDGTDSSVNGYLANVRQYEYDTDGWKVRSYDTYDFSEIDEVTIELEAGTGLDDTRLLAFTNTDIYSFNGYAILHEASTEYYEVTDTPTVTPEPTPGSGSSGSGDSDDNGSSGGSSSGSGGTVVGGDAKPGGMLDFLVTLATLVWTELFAVEVPVDGYMISFQQIVIYGAVVGMLIWGGCKLFGKKG